MTGQYFNKINILARPTCKCQTFFVYIFSANKFDFCTFEFIIAQKREKKRNNNTKYNSVTIIIAMHYTLILSVTSGCGR